MEEVKLGSIVVFKDPGPDEMFNGDPLRFVVKEHNGDRCLIEPVTIPLYITPLLTVRTEDIEVIKCES